MKPQLESDALLDAIGLASLDHVHAIADCNRHRFFHQDMFSGFGGQSSVFSVEVVGGGNEYDVYPRISKQLLDRCVGRQNFGLARECFRPVLVSALGRDDRCIFGQSRRRRDPGVWIIPGADECPTYPQSNTPS